MAFVLKDEIEVSRNIVFLCGPFYQKDNKSDRRNIMRNTLKRYYKSNILPLIIDNIFAQDNFNDKNINIQLLEEIFAAISLKTYVFLDTLSAAAEMGLFTNHAFKNNLVVYLPYQTDILNKGLVGAFIRDGILDGKGNCIKVMKYRPQIRRSAIASDYVVEHYGFINDKMPENIESDIKNDVDLHKNLSHKIVISEKKEFPDNFCEMTYFFKGSNLIINSSVKLLFIVVTSLMYELYGSILKMDKSITINDFDMKRIADEVKEVYENYVLRKEEIYCENIFINTVLRASYEEILYHIVTFVYMYHCRSTYHGYKLLGSRKGNIIEYTGRHPYKVFGINKEEVEVLENAKKNVDKYFERITIKRNGKRRDLIKYADTEEGEKIRSIHEKISVVLERKYIRHDMSYAYRKGYSIKDCIKQHLDNSGFFKCDISKFFNSINCDKLVRIIEEIFVLDKSYNNITKRIVEGFFVDGIMPLGLVTSPVLSDIYMHEFDVELEKFANENNYIYTRYADDIMISSERKIEDDNEKMIMNFLAEKLKNRKLRLNNKKMQNIYLENLGQNIRYIGINIVKGRGNNYLSIGKKYIYNVAKEYLEYFDIKNEKQKFYEKRRILGKIAFIRQIEGEEGWNRFRKRLNNDEKYIRGTRLWFGD